MEKPVQITSRRGPKPGSPRTRPTQPVTQPILMSFLAAEAANRNETPTQLADHLGIGYVYLTQLLRGLKPVDRLSRPVLAPS